MQKRIKKESCANNSLELIFLCETQSSNTTIVSQITDLVNPNGGIL